MVGNAGQEDTGQGKDGGGLHAVFVKVDTTGIEH